MKTLAWLFVLFICPTFATARSLQSLPFQSLDGQELSLESLAGKAFFVVNIATRCGYTPQLEELEKLHQDFKKRGLVVVGIPSNDFGGQTPEAPNEVQKFCKVKYGVSFPLTEKMSVRGPDKHPFIQALLSEAKDSSEIKWNFEKFFVRSDGTVVQRFPSKIKPNDPTIVRLIGSELKP